MYRLIQISILLTSTFCFAQRKDAEVFIDQLRKSGIDSIIFYYHQDATYGWANGTAEARIIWQDKGNTYFKYYDTQGSFKTLENQDYGKVFSYYSLHKEEIKDESPFESNALKHFYEPIDTVYVDREGKFQGVYRKPPDASEVEQFVLRIIFPQTDLTKEITGNHFWSVSNPTECIKNYDLKFYSLMQIAGAFKVPEPIFRLFDCIRPEQGIKEERFYRYKSAIKSELLYQTTIQYQEDGRPTYSINITPAIKDTTYRRWVYIDGKLRTMITIYEQVEDTIEYIAVTWDKFGNATKLIDAEDSAKIYIRSYEDCRNVYTLYRVSGKPIYERWRKWDGRRETEYIGHYHEKNNSNDSIETKKYMTSYEYVEYNEHGDWIKRIGTDDNGEQNLELREIDYY